MKKQGLKKRMILLLILLAGGHMTARPGVIITGILDGTLDGGCPKAIEIFVTGTENLNYYEVWRSLNGGTFGAGSGSISSMSGVYTNTFVYLVKTDHVDAFHDVFGNEGIFSHVVPMGIINGNGNDGFQVRLKVGSVVIDQVWYESASYSYENSYWYRKHGTGPDGGWVQSAWYTPGNNALEGMDQDGLQAAVPFGTYAATWQGLTTDWNNTGNWSLGIIPSFQTNVLIRGNASNFPVISNLPASPAVCMNLTLTDSARLTVQAGKALTVHGNLLMETLPPAGSERGLILDSDSSLSPTGSLMIKGSATGTLLVRRFIPKDNSWHLLASPVNGQAIQPDFVPDPVDLSYDLYSWDENLDMTEAWCNSRGSNNQWSPGFDSVFMPGKGYLVAYAPNNTGPAVRTFAGDATIGNYAYQLNHSNNTWNLLGNPYSCALDWASDGIDKTYITGDAVYFWDPALNENQGGYRVHNGTTGVPDGTASIIPALQGFFVQASDAGTMPVDIGLDDPLVHGDQPYYKAKEELAGNHVRLRINRGLLSDETLICFDEAATNGYDQKFDATKLFNGREGCPEIYSMADQEMKLCINTLSTSPVSIPVGISCSQSAELVITTFDFADFDPAIGIFLEDKLVNLWIDLREQNVYRYYHDPALAEGRFVVHFMDVAGDQEKWNPGQAGLWASGSDLYIANSGNSRGKLEILTVDGRCVKKLEIPGGKSVIRLDLPGGIYIARLTVPSGKISRKIFIN
jgi:hypothetical protein